MNQEQDVSTRKVILNMLKTRGALSVNDMSKQLGITEMAVRRHLNTLERDSLIDSKLVRQAMGRPTHMYFLTVAADELFPKKYHHLTLDLLEELQAVAGDDKVELLFERRKDKLISRYEERMAGKSLDERVQALADIQNANGYMVELEKTDAGNYVLNEYNCPIAQVANQYNHACNCELSMFQSLLGTEVERTECLAKGDSKCTYRIQKQ
ncbi:helix-turn-helix transcriptional regulator [Paenibacillus allorhizosphaerae]|uniref:HTH deoR-type domain-containing protein n=1 Tax=Paenibacillus allorhizosphaerae TaxID=2849866 RepID=A0ABM8VTA5_9BACL|nr:metalloregulator ArsR/SmtB family transcription factor [Paenibacillus allorhizosphaerae]CAG7657335.1 hypothetical protein PAECIP111802_06697 [Paenibacillus allorhizosphaerae]